MRTLGMVLLCVAFGFGFAGAVTLMVFAVIAAVCCAVLSATFDG